MNKIVQFYNDHKTAINLILLFVIIPIIIIQILNFFAAKHIDKIEEEKAERANTIFAESHYEGVSGQRVNAQVYKEQTNIIDEFIKRCNENDTQGAYDLLSEECKEMQYPSIKIFIDGYYSKRFESKQMYNCEVWSGNTYRIELRQDALTTGIFRENNYTEDYYTVIGDKLNINKFIKRQYIDKEITQNNIKMKITNLDFHKDYSICSIEISNENENEISLAAGEENSDAYLVDENGIHYVSLISEINEEELKIASGQSKSLQIRFSNVYRSDLTVKKIVFNDITIYQNAGTNGEKEVTKKTMLEIKI